MILPPGYEVHVSTGVVYRFGADCPVDVLKTYGVYDQVNAWNTLVAQAVKTGNVDQSTAQGMATADLQAIVNQAAVAAAAAAPAKAASAPTGSGS